MAALIVMDSGGGPAVGTTTLPGSGVNTPVLCTNFDDTGVLAWKWELIDVPEPSVTYNPIPPPTLLSSVTITPDVKGHTILIRLTTYSDAGASVVDGVDQKAIRVRFDPPFDWIIPAAHEKIEGDALRGWAVEVNELLRDVQAFMAAPPSAGIVDDPTIRTSNFNAVAGTRYFLDSTFSMGAALPFGPTDGDVVAFAGVRNFNGILTVLGNGSQIRGAGTSNVFNATYTVKFLDIAFRYTAIYGIWESISSAVGAMAEGGAIFTGNSFTTIDNNGAPVRVKLVNGDSVPGRVGSGAIQELRPWHVAHNLYDSNQSNEQDASSGVQTLWMGTNAFARATTVEWIGVADVIVRGLYADNNNIEFRHDKVLLNNTGANGTGAFHNIIWKNEDTGALAPSYRIRHTAAAPTGTNNIDFADYVQGPGETVVLRYNSALSRWFITPMAPSGRIDRSLHNTFVSPVTIHTHIPHVNNRLIMYRVQVFAISFSGSTALFDITALFNVDGGGGITEMDVAFVNGPYRSAGAATWDVTFLIGGGSIQTQVLDNGFMGTDWRIVGTITEHG